MAGLNCSTPSTTAYDIIKDTVDLFLSIDDHFCKMAINMLFKPKGDDV